VIAWELKWKPINLNNGETEKSKARIKKKLNKKFSIRQTHTVTSPRTVVVETSHTMFAPFAMSRANLLLVVTRETEQFISDVSIQENVHFQFYLIR
jgi:hypothetical protein